MAILDEYKLFVDDTARFSDRRQTISNFYLTVNSVLLVAIGLLAKDLGAKSVLNLLLPLPLVVAGVAACLWWRELIGKYKALIKLRINKLREMETEIPDSVQMYHAEDELYPRNETDNLIPGTGLNISDIEKRLPHLFAVLYAIYGVVLVGAASIKMLVWIVRAF